MTYVLASAKTPCGHDRGVKVTPVEVGDHVAYEHVCAQCGAFIAKTLPTPLTMAALRDLVMSMATIPDDSGKMIPVEMLPVVRGGGSA